MKPKEPITINLNVDGRVLVVLGIVVGLILLAYSVARAQAGSPPDINSYQGMATTNPLVITPGSIPIAPQLNCAGGLLPTTNGDCVTADNLGALSPASSGITPFTAIGTGRHFYVTSSQYATNAVLTACASGYHMASLWEILDVSSLTYDYDPAVAKTNTDAGYGPPASWNGWVRTGSTTSGSSTTGMGNCQNWSSVSGSDYGVSVQLISAWETTPGDISTWNANSYPCNYIGPVWCVK